MIKKKRLIVGLVSFLMLFSISVYLTAGAMPNDQMVLLDDSFTPQSALSYAIAPNHLSPFIYRGKTPYPWIEADTTGCEVGRMYVYNRNTNGITPIGTANVSRFAATKEELFIVTADQKILQTDYQGSAFMELYQVPQATINWIGNFGNILYFVEDNERLMFLDTNTGNTQLVLTATDMVSAVVFNADKLVWYNSLGQACYYNTFTQQSIVMDNEYQTNVLIMQYTSSDENATPPVSVNSLASHTHNDIPIPLGDYPAVYGVENFDHLTVLRRFEEGYANSNQCDAFAKFAHDSFFHIMDRERDRPSWVVNGSNTADVHSDTIYWYNDSSAVARFFEDLDRGSFVRYTKLNDPTPEDGAHSIVFDKISPDGDGIIVYESNQDDENGVGYQKYYFLTLSTNYTGVLYYVEHALRSPSIQDDDYHIVECLNCDAYLRQRHEMTRLVNGRFRCMDCGYTSSFSDGTIQSIQPICIE